MTENSIVIKNFIDKVRLAQSHKSKDIRLTIEEAADLVAWIAMINTNQLDFERIVVGLNSLHMKIDKGISKSKSLPDGLPGINGGAF